MKYRHLFSNRFEKPKVRGQKIKNITANEWLYVFGFATHILQFKAQKPIGKTDIYNVLYAGR